jgi:hypothetical protein
MLAMMALTVATATPALASQRVQTPDFGTATPVPGYSDYEITDDGFLTYEGDIGIAKCASVERNDFTSTSLYKEVVNVCERAGFAPKGERTSEMVTLTTPLADTGGPPLLLLPIALLLGSALLIRRVAFR